MHWLVQRHDIMMSCPLMWLHRINKAVLVALYRVELCSLELARDWP